MTFDVTEIRNLTKILAPTADFDGSYTFYYDETNNIRKFYVKEADFNYSFSANFVLGGIVHEGSSPDFSSLFTSLNLQKTIKEVKLKHIAKGEFLECLKADKLNYFLKYLLESECFIHYSSINILYYSLVDIVDSAIVNSESAVKLGPAFANHLKNDLYKLAKLEIDSVIDVFYKFQYPNIKQNDVLSFIGALTSLFDKYLRSFEFHFGLESLRQILKESKKKGSLPFIMDEDDYILLKDFSHFYLRPLYIFKNSQHIFDNELSILEIIDDFKLVDEGREFKNYSFVDSKSSLIVQASDIFVGLIGKLGHYLNTSTRDKIKTDFSLLTHKQKDTVKLLLSVIDKSNEKNIGFLHATDSYEEMSKMNVIQEILIN